MNDAVRKLAQSMLDAEREKRAWNAGRFAFRDRGEIAINPNPPGSHEPVSYTHLTLPTKA